VTGPPAEDGGFLEYALARSGRKSSCRIGDILDSLDDVGAQDLRDALDVASGVSPNGLVIALHDLLQIDVSTSTIERHRRRGTASGCHCE